MATRDLYAELGRQTDGDVRRDQEGLPEARAQVSPRRQSREPRSRGALQAHLVRARRPLRRRRSARPTTSSARTACKPASTPIAPASTSARRSRWAAASTAAVWAAAAAVATRASRTSSATSSAAAAAAAPRPSAGPTSRRRSTIDLLDAVRGTTATVALTKPTECAVCHGTGGQGPGVDVSRVPRTRPGEDGRRPDVVRPALPALQRLRAHSRRSRVRPATVAASPRSSRS